MNSNQKGFHLIAAVIAVFVLLGVGFAGWRVYSNANEPGQNEEKHEEEQRAAMVESLPDISELQANPSDRFLVDPEVVFRGHPFLGEGSPAPHDGAHVHFTETYKHWPKGGTAPENYPPVYAVADGVIDRVDYKSAVGDNDQYSLSLTFAKEGAETWSLDYGIEPFVKEPSADFYRGFINVEKGQEVKKGDIIAYLYIPNPSEGAHIHFHMRRSNDDQFYPPAIFTDDVVKAFKSRWGEFGVQKGQKVPQCMGWKLAANENPFGKNPTDCL